MANRRSLSPGPSLRIPPRVVKHLEGCHLPRAIERRPGPTLTQPWEGASPPQRARSCPRPRSDAKRFPSNDFTHCFTLSPETFSSFGRSTFSLSVSRWYLALDGVYHPLWAAFPNNPTRRKRVASQPAQPHGALTLHGGPSQGTSAKTAQVRHDPKTHSSSTQDGSGLQGRAPPPSFATTEGIPVGFFSSAY